MDWPNPNEAQLHKALGKAIDEVYFLRSIAANEARILEAHLEYKTFPKTRRHFAEGQVEKLRQAARGDAEEVYRTYRYPKNALLAAGGNPQMSNQDWLIETGLVVREPSDAGGDS